MLKYLIRQEQEIKVGKKKNKQKPPQQKQHI